MLKEVRLPYGKTVRFEYDALGASHGKAFHGHVFRYLWDGNVMVQEWQYEEKDDRSIALTSSVASVCRAKSQ